MRFSPCAWAVMLSALAAAAQPDDPAKAPALTPKEVVERAGPSVVLIEATTAKGTQQGSGFVVAEDGAVATNLHVIDGATKVKVSFPDGASFEAGAVRGFDVRKDLAVLLVELPRGGALPATTLGDASAVEPGQPVLVISNPLGLQQTVTEGLASAWREPREPSPDDAAGGATPQVLLPSCRLLQISAAISPGSSGGPVFDERGEVIGVASAGVLYGSAGLNFAVPADELRPLIEDDDAMDLTSFRERVDRQRLELAEPHLEDAELALERDERDRARRHLAMALLVYPKYVRALVLAGRVHTEEGRFEDAERSLTAAVQAGERNAEAWYHLGRLYHLQAQDTNSSSGLAMARAAYEKSLELDDRNAEATVGLAVVSLHQGDLGRAEELLRRAVEADSSLADAHYLLGEVHLQRGRQGEAAEAFEKALWEDGDHALAHFGLARLYTDERHTRHGNAAHHWEEFLRLSEDDPSLAREREFALRVVERYFPELLDG